MRWIKGLILAVILLVVLLVGILFAVNNQQTIALNLIWAELPPCHSRSGCCYVNFRRYLRHACHARCLRTP